MVSYHRQNLDGADFTHASLESVRFEECSLEGATFHGADLTEATLARCNLLDVDLRDAILRHTNFSGSTGLPSASNWLCNNFDTTDGGYIVFKSMSPKTPFEAGKFWSPVRAGRVLSEVVNPDRTCPCGSGVSFATRSWFHAQSRYTDIWRCLLAWRDLPDVIVPFSTTGDARCSQLTLIEKAPA